jgi:CubicO group peptidase (beta-lactamase class C family)
VIDPAFAPLVTRISAWVKDGRIPGAVVVAGRSSGPVFVRAIGRRALLPRREPMTVRTIFDLASLTKVMVTAPLVVERAVRGELDLEAPLGRYVEETRGSEAGTLPLHLLLTHTAGLCADNPMRDYSGTKERLFAAIARGPLEFRPGARFLYSDVGFVLLQGVLERATGFRLDRLATEELFGPLGFRDTRYGVRAADRARTAPTEREGGRWLRGRVHDPRARTRALGGIAGHAGVFGTARETARFCEMILRGGLSGRRRILSEETVRLLVSNHCPMRVRVRRGYGFDIESPYSSPRGERFSLDSFGHSGYTGVSLWIDPERDGYVVLLTNSVHAGGHKDLKALRYDVGTWAARGLRAHGRRPPGRPGASRRKGRPRPAA